MKDTQDIFVDEVRQNVNLGVYSIIAMKGALKDAINANWHKRGEEGWNFVLRSLIRGLRDLRKAS